MAFLETAEGSVFFIFFSFHFSVGACVLNERALSTVSSKRLFTNSLLFTEKSVVYLTAMNSRITAIRSDTSGSDTLRRVIFSVVF